MTLFVGFVAFLLLAFTFWRLSEAALARWVIVLVGIAAFGLLALNLLPQLNGHNGNVLRGLASLTLAAMLFGSLLVPTTLGAGRKIAPKNKNPTRSKTPTLTGLSRPKVTSPSHAGKPASMPKGSTGKIAARSGGKPGNSNEQPLSEYELLEKVGIGGMATVWRANRRQDGKSLALKIPQEKFVADAKFVRRFHREAEVLMRLSHPNIVKVFDHASEGVTHYIAMEMLEGDSLEHLIETRRLTLGHSVEIMKYTADALRYIHKQGIIHRDIKPGNIMLLRGALHTQPEPRVDPDGVKLMDFGIAAGKVLTRLTMTGARVGTPVYMSPEQARGLKLDHRSDIYSLGLVFYEMVTGTTAFKGGYEAVVSQQIFQTPTPPRQVNLDVPIKLNDLVMRMVEKDPDKRPSLAEVIEAVEGGLFEDKTILDAPAQIILSVNTRRGIMRILDTRGNLDRSFGHIGQQSADKLTVAPNAVAVDAKLNLYAAVIEYKNGEVVGQMIRKLSSEGQELQAFGAHGMRPGDLMNPIAMAYNHTNHQLYVLDNETSIVTRYGQSGEYIGKFGARGQGRGSFENPKAIQTGPDGLVYVLDYGSRQVQRFNPEGQFLNKYAFRMSEASNELRLLDGIGVDAHGTIYISDAASSKIRTIKTDGRQGQTFIIENVQGEDTSAVLDIAIDHQSYVYAARRGAHFIRKFAPNGSLVANIETYAPTLSMAMFLREPVAAQTTS